MMSLDEPVFAGVAQSGTATVSKTVGETLVGSNPAPGAKFFIFFRRAGFEPRFPGLGYHFPTDVQPRTRKIVH
jgi:hypothetical protein